jgi:peptide/nickel transport system ATP-binding protein
VRHLSTFFDTDEGLIRSVADVSFSIRPGKTTALVGESGSGKSVTSLTLMRLLSRTPPRQVSGEAMFTNRAGQTLDLLSLPEPEMRRMRGNEIAMIFQEPMTSLNPVFTVGEQIAEAVRLHMGLDRKAALAHALRMLELVEIPAAAQRLHEYPHQLSGGMRQRVMIALAMACNPTLLIADEPTTALDVTIQAQILELMRRLQAETGMSILFITHNLGVVAHHADDVAVMYAGRMVEAAPCANCSPSRAHPYTQGLLACLPAQQRKRELASGQTGPNAGCTRSAARSPARWRRRRAAPSSRAATWRSRLAATPCRLARRRPNPQRALHTRGRNRHGHGGGCMSAPLIEVKNLQRYFGATAKPVRAVDDVSFSIQPGETLGLVGESGSGKSTIGRTLLRLIEPPRARCCTAAKTWARRPAAACARCAASCRSSSRTPTPA